MSHGEVGAVDVERLVAVTRLGQSDVVQHATQEEQLFVVCRPGRPAELLCKGAAVQVGANAVVEDRFSGDGADEAQGRGGHLGGGEVQPAREFWQVGHGGVLSVMRGAVRKCRGGHIQIHVPYGT